MQNPEQLPRVLTFLKTAQWNILFTINDISILPSDDELRKYQTPEDLLLCYAHSIYSKF
jgi:hypothetical protein